MLTQAGCERGAWYLAEPRGGFRLVSAQALAAPKHVDNEAELAAQPGLDAVVSIKGRHGADRAPGRRRHAAAQAHTAGAVPRSVSAAAPRPLAGALLEDERERLSRRLSVKVYQLHNLFELSRELTSTFDDETVHSLATATLMGHLMVSRCGALPARQRRQLRARRGARLPPREPRQARRLRRGVASRSAAARRRCVSLNCPRVPSRALMTRMRIGLVAPVVIAGRCEAMLLAGERSSGRSFTDEDCEFAPTLARQAVGALETVRLHEVSLEKQRQDREMQIAREIQQSLFPEGAAASRGFEVAARSEPCFAVGGDYYDVIPLSPRPLLRWPSPTCRARARPRAS